ncbi:MAG: hypothetical protein EPN65_15205 [Pandoraea sp.]|uniref:hypothetical protein n=1 Tax=Pandoraea sp. TaxID=1883445 RepID=UPI0011FC8DB6|nr:hypothetical protein [Pandoraea sp.]TAM16074.1 MAG: hypothetical protein EPN65_15205 [Pandoraea sp.]
MNTLLLDRTTWDLCKDASGNIAMASDPYAIAQDVASAVRTFLGECWYDTTKGVPYWSDILGHQPPLQLVKKDIVAAAMTVTGVAAAQCFITGLVGRTLTGQVQGTTSSGQPFSINF